jgi:hypothetical protein
MNARGNISGGSVLGLQEDDGSAEDQHASDYAADYKNGFVFLAGGFAFDHHGGLFELHRVT